MAAEPKNQSKIRTAQTSSGAVDAIRAPNARATFVPLPTQQKNYAGRVQTATVPAIRANNSRQSIPYR